VAWLKTPPALKIFLDFQCHYPSALISLYPRILGPQHSSIETTEHIKQAVMAMLDRKMVGEASRTNATVIITNVGSVLKVGGFQCTYTPYICILQISIALIAVS